MLLDPLVNIGPVKNAMKVPLHMHSILHMLITWFYLMSKLSTIRTSW